MHAGSASHAQLEHVAGRWPYVCTFCTLIDMRTCGWSTRSPHVYTLGGLIILPEVLPCIRRPSEPPGGLPEASRSLLEASRSLLEASQSLLEASQRLPEPPAASRRPPRASRSLQEASGASCRPPGAPRSLPILAGGRIIQSEGYLTHPEYFGEQHNANTCERDLHRICGVATSQHD